MVEETPEFPHGFSEPQLQDYLDELVKDKLHQGAHYLLC